MGYVDKQIAKYRRQYANAVSAKRLRDSLRQLQEKSQIKDSLKALPARGSIVAKRKIARRAGAAGAVGWTEQSRTFHDTLREARSSDGLFVVEFYNIAVITMTDGTKFSFLDYDPDA